MCLIIANIDGRPIPESYLRKAYSINKNGFGIMYSAETGKLEIIKGLFDADEIVKTIKWLEGYEAPYVAHFRMATRGSINNENAHPFLISEVDGGVAFAHNGTFIGIQTIKNESDTAAFADEIKSMVDFNKLDISTVFNSTGNHLLREYSREIGTYNKLAFMSGQGKINLINEETGLWFKGVWYSNLYSIGKSTNDEIAAHHVEALHNPIMLSSVLAERHTDEELSDTGQDKKVYSMYNSNKIKNSDDEGFYDDDFDLDAWREAFYRDMKGESDKKNKERVKKIKVDDCEIELTEDEIDELRTSDEIKNQIRKAFAEAGYADEEENAKDHLKDLKEYFENQGKETNDFYADDDGESECCIVGGNQEEEDDDKRDTTPVTLSTSTSMTTTTRGYDWSSGYRGSYSGYTSTYYDENSKFVEMLLAP